MLSQISLSNDTVNGRIDELSDQDIKDQLLDQIKQTLFFAIQCDETTDTGKCSRFLVYAGFLSVNMAKEMQFCHPMKSRATSTDIFNVVSNFFQENQLSRKSLARVFRYGVPAMLGLQSGFFRG